MRMRRKPNLNKRIEQCKSLLITDPENRKGQWRETFGFRKLHLELGCGKGSFTIETASQNSDILLVALEKVDNVLITAMEKALDKELKNVRFLCKLADEITNYFDEGEIERIFINFCDPWPAFRHSKRRLTSKIFLDRYKKVLAQDGEIHFKTDNSDLFNFSLDEFEYNGFKLVEISRNLHEYGTVGVMTDYEKKFHAEGMPIYRCVARNI